jgi:hypothetical protein
VLGAHAIYVKLGVEAGALIGKHGPAPASKLKGVSEKTFSNCPRHARSKSSIILSFVRRRIHHSRDSNIASCSGNSAVLIWRPQPFVICSPGGRFSLANDRSLLITINVMNESAANSLF